MSEPLLTVSLLMRCVGQGFDLGYTLPESDEPEEDRRARVSSLAWNSLLLELQHPVD